MDLWAYTGVVYGVAAEILTVAVLASRRLSLAGNPRQDWLVFGGSWSQFQAGGSLSTRWTRSIPPRP